MFRDHIFLANSLQNLKKSNPFKLYYLSKKLLHPRAKPLNL